MDFPFVKEAIQGLFSKPSCAMYPVVPSEAAEGYRGRIKFYPEKCIACGMCIRVCAAGAITDAVEEIEEGKKITKTFNMGSCTFCNTCADFCHEKAIELTRDYHMIATKEEDLLESGTFIKKKPVKKAAPAPTAAEETPALPVPAARDDGKPVCNPNNCVYCTLCAIKCPVKAITVDRAAKTWSCDYDTCVGCGNCAEVCRKNAVIIG